MTQAVAVLREGHAYQSRMFWRRAANLLDPTSAVIRVAFEKGPKGFDDIWVEYAAKRGPKDAFGRVIAREHLQCKWHVTAADFRHDDLVHPDFINASSYSFLQRARDAYRISAEAGVIAQFALLTNWTVARDDPLATLIVQRNHALRIDDLFQGTTARSAFQRLRKLWCDHLGITEDELRALAGALAFKTDTMSLDDHRAHLDLIFENRGLARVPVSESSFKYDDLVFQWLSQGRIEFDKTSFREACAGEELLQTPKNRPVYGVKTREHPVDRLEDRCMEVLDVTRLFDARSILDHEAWRTTLLPELKKFLITAARSSDNLRLILDAHATVAFAAGTVLDVKSGRHIELEQRTLGRHIWSATDQDHDSAWPTWVFQHGDEASGDELVIAVSATHNVLADVNEHRRGSDAPKAALLHALLAPSPGATAIKCGRHAFELAECLAREVQRLRASQPKNRIHLYLAAPNVFAFMLGQQIGALSPVTLYEFDFGGTRTYQSSLTLS